MKFTDKATERKWQEYIAVKKELEKYSKLKALLSLVRQPTGQVDPELLSELTEQPTLTRRMRFW